MYSCQGQRLNCNLALQLSMRIALISKTAQSFLILFSVFGSIRTCRIGSAHCPFTKPSGTLL